MADKKQNPFRIDDSAYRMKSKLYGKPFITDKVDENTGEVIKVKNVTYIDKESDAMKFVKVYDVSTIENISITAYKLLLYIIRFVGYDNKVFLSRDYFRKHFKYKQRRSFYNAINDLVDAQVIKKDEGDLYWVNPNIICKGNRDK